MKAKNSFKGKPLLFRSAISALILVLGIACQEENEVMTQGLEEENVMLAVHNEEVMTLFEEVEDIAMDVTETRETESDKRLANSHASDWRCGSVTHDTIQKIFTIDFGTACTGQDGKTRSGKIIITYDKRLFLPGAQRTITLENYIVDSLKVMGTKIITNESESLTDFIRLNVQLVNGQVIWPDQSVAMRSFNRTKTWMRAANPISDEYQIEGTVEGVTRLGISYRVEIMEPLIYKRSCRFQGVFLPVDGVKDIMRTDKPDTEINYGEGECDNIVVITQSQQSQEVNIASEIIRLRKLASR